MSVMGTLAVAVFATVFAAGLLGLLCYSAIAYFWQWEMAAALLGMVLTCIGYAKLTKEDFKKHLGKVVFILLACVVPSTTFVRQVVTDTYPLGNDLAGGVELLYQLDYASLDRKMESAAAELQRLTNENASEKDVRQAQITQQTLRDNRQTAHEKAAEVIRRRVDPTGTKGIPVTTYARGTRIRIQLPKASPAEAKRIKDAIRTQGNLTFHLVIDDQQKVQQAIDKKQEVPGCTLLYKEKRERYTDKVTAEPILVKSLPDLDGSYIALAMDHFGNEGPEVSVRFNPAGATKFEQLTGANVNKRMAIVLDGKVASDPVIKERISGECRISGSFTQDEAKELAAILTAGSLPVEVQLESEFVMGPSLGRESIKNGVIASSVGAAVVVVFMSMYYRVGGLVATLCLVICLGVTVGAMGFFKATLTMPGIAGIVLTLGMAVDANVLIYERIREERARGRNLRMAIQAAFDRVYVTVLDSQLTTLIAGIILYYLGTGPIRGFAVSLCIGVVVSLFANLWCSRVFLEWLVQNDLVKDLRFWQWVPETHFDFMRIRKIAIAITGSLVVLSAVLFGLKQKDIYDVDFTGGALIQVNFLKPKDVEEVRAKIQEAKPKVRDELARSIEEMRKVVAESAGKEAIETRQLLAQRLPNLAEEAFGEVVEINAERIQQMADDLTGQLPKIEAEQFVTVGVGEREEGKNRSFTISTRLSHPIVLAAMNRTVLGSFPGQLGAEPFEVSGPAGRLLVRASPESSTPEHPEEQMKTALRSAIAAAAARPDLKIFEEPLRKLAVAPDVTLAPGGEKEYSVGPLPQDEMVRRRVVNVLREEITQSLRKDLAQGPISRTQAFGSVVAGEMVWTAALALFLSWVGITVYVWFRFEFSFSYGFGAVLALIHDAMMAIGALTIANMLGMNIYVNLNVVAAVLTIIGYSVNDTIVIFDRIREVKQAHPTRDFGEIINEAVNATLSRSILTSLTVLMTVVALLIFGGDIIMDLAFTLLIGFICGVYSTVFIASPLVLWWMNLRKGKGEAAQQVAPAPGKA